MQTPRRSVGVLDSTPGMSPTPRGARCSLAAWPRYLFSALLVSLFFSAQALADADPSFSVQGFGTLGAVRSDTDDVEFVRDLSQARGATNDWTAKTDSVLGLQANWQIAPKWQAVAQGISRYRYDRSFKPEMAWAFVKYEPAPNLSLRAGRLGTDFFMQADSRWVGYSFLTVRPPGDFFWYLPFYSIHGADVALSVPAGEGIVRGKVFYGLSRGKIPLAEEQWEINASPMRGGYLEYQAGAWQVRASYANIRFKRDLPIASVVKQESGYDLNADQQRFLAAKGTRTHYYSLGVIYDRGPWQAQLMLNHIRQGTRTLEDSDGGYALIGYRTGQVTPYVGYSWVRSKAREKPVTGDPLADAVTAYVMQDAHSEQNTRFLGMRWDVARNVALKAQWDRVQGSSSSLFPYRRDDRPNWDGRMDVFSLSMDFVF